MHTPKTPSREEVMVTVELNRDLAEGERNKHREKARDADLARLLVTCYPLEESQHN